VSLNSNVLPKLRIVDTKPLLKDGRLFIAVQDPLRLSDKTIIIPQPIAPILALCDGTRDARGLSASLAIRHGLSISVEEIEQLVTTLDKALLLDNARFVEALDQARVEYLEAPFRQPILAGRSYPEDPGELKSYLTGYMDAVDSGSALMDGRGLVSPHIDYERGGPVYAQVWGRAAEFVRAADLAIVFGTDHFSDDNRLTLTRQNYATPFGILPTAREVVDALAKIIGEESAFAGELLHRGEHSIELAATWMHFIRDGQPCELVPITCNTFSFFFKDNVDPENDPLIDQLIQVVKSTTAGRQVIIVAAGDLSHVGPVFGDYPLDILGRARLQAADDELLNRMCTGDEQGFFEAIKRVEDDNNVCGAVPIYMTMRLLSPVQGERVAYDLCPADEQGTSLVSICGVVFN
jgi:AmmeMemoRadiSam system protein B